MAGSAINIKANAQEVINLKRKIDELSSALVSMQRSANPALYDKLNNELQKTTIKYNSLRSEVNQYAKEQERAAKATSSSANEMLSLFAKIGGTTAIIGLGKQIMDVRNEFQQLEIAFGTMLKSEEKAAILMKDLTKFAAETPFGLQSAASGAKQLLAYGSTADTVIKELTMLGDVAAGTGQQIGDLVYLYGTLRTQGRAYLMDIRQFAGRGIPIYDELAKVLNTSKDKVNDFVSAGKVGFKEVEQAFKNMTAQGGLYGGLMEAQSKSIGGRMEALKDNINSIFNQIGKDSEGFIYKSIDGINTLVENYETVGKVLLGLVATYGIATAAEKFHIAMMMVQATSTTTVTGTKAAQIVVTNALTAAQDRLNASMLANPYVLAAAAVVALGYGIYKLATYQTEAEEAQSRLNETTKEYESNIEGEKVKLDILFGRLKSAKEGTDKYKEAKQGILDIADSYHLSISKDIDLVKDETKYRNILNAAIIETAKAKAIESGTQKATEIYTKTWGDAISDIRERFIKKFGESQGELLLDSLKESLSEGKDLTNEVQDAIGKFSTTYYGSSVTGGGSTTLNPVQQLVTNVQLSKKTLEKEVSDLEGVFGKLKKSTDEDSKKTAKALQDQIFSATKNVQDLKNELKDLQKGIIPDASIEDASFDFAKTIEEKTKSLKEAEDKLSYLVGGKSASSQSKENKAGESAAEKARKQAQKEADEQLKIDNEKIKAELDARNVRLEIRQEEINLWEDSFQKEQAQLDLNHKKDLLAIDKRTQDLIEKEQERRRKIWDIANPNGAKTPYKTDVKSVLDLGSRDQGEMESSEDIANQKQLKATDDLLKSLLAKYQDYNAQRFEINKKYETDLAALEAEASKNPTDDKDRAIAELKKQWSEALSSINLEEFQDQINWSVLFSDLDKISTDELVKLRDKVKRYLQSVGKSLSPKDLKTVTDAFENLNNKVSDKKPVSELSNAYKDYLEALKEVIAAKKEQSKYEEATPEYVKATEALAAAENKRNDARVRMANSMQKTTSKAQGYADAGKELINTLDVMGVKMSDSIRQALTGVDEILEGRSKMAQGLKEMNAALMIQGAIEQTRGYFNLVAGLIGGGKHKSQKDTERLQEVTSRIEASNEAINKLIEKRISLIKESTAAEGQYLNQLTQEQIKQQQQFVESQFNNVKGNWLFAKKGKNNNLTVNDVMRLYGLNDLEDFTEWWNSGGYQELLSEGYGLADKDMWDSLVNSWTELEEAAKNAGTAMKEAATGTTFDALKDSLDDLVQSADTTFEDIGDSFEEHMRNAVMNFVKSSYLTNALQQWYDKFAEAYSDDVLSQSEVDQLRKMYEEAYSKAQNMYDAALDVAGISKYSSDSSQQASSGGFETMSQDTGKALEGRFTAMQMNLISIDQNVSRIAQWNQPVSEKFNFDTIAMPLGALNQSSTRIERMIEENRSIAINSYYELKDINKNTKELYQMNERLGNIEKNTKGFATKK